MAKKIRKNLVAAIDIGTTKVVTLIAELPQEGNAINIIGYGVCPSRGLKRGIVVNIETTMQAITESVMQAEEMAGCEINEVYTGVSGSHIRGFNSHGIVAIRQQEIAKSDIERVLDAAKAVAIPADQRMLHVIPQEYFIDNQAGINDPIGMSGVRLEAKVHIVTGAVSAIQNVVKCVQRCGFEVNDVILEQLASSYAVLDDDEKDLGVCLIDIGGGTTDIAVFIDGAIRHSAVIPIAGDQVTNDIAVVLRTPTQCAEKIKLSSSCLVTSSSRDELIAVPSSSGNSSRDVQANVLNEVVEARYSELFTLVATELKRSGYFHLVRSGIVMTGGASSVEGGQQLAEKIFDMPVRVANPSRIMGKTEVIDNPIFATAVGLLQSGLANDSSEQDLLSGSKNSNKGVWGKMKNWFQVNF
ncbi:MAG: cell division protein FtsA [Pseudomonadota bacterium]|nr:cell division protein FtsA [Pseudomonadota bacterium]